MSGYASLALRALRAVAERPDPTAALTVGALGSALRIGLSSASRLAAALDHAGLLEHTGAHGSYRLGTAAITLSGRAATPVAGTVRAALLRAAQETGETICLAAPEVSGADTGSARIVAMSPSAWTLHAPADIGERVDDRGDAIVAAVHARNAAADPVESERGRAAEFAVPVLAPDGTPLAAVAARVPVFRARQGRPRARRAIVAAARRIEQATAEHWERQPRRQGRDRPVPDSPTSIDAVVAVLRHLADGPDTASGIAAATGLRLDRIRRLIDACLDAGMATGTADGRVCVSWTVHAWHRATVDPILRCRGVAHVHAAAAETGACAYLTVLRGMRSQTLVEQLEALGPGLRMSPWLDRPHPIIGSDGGPSLVVDLDPADISALLSRRHASHEIAAFLDRVADVRRDGVLAVESIEEFSITSVSAPVHDASGGVVAAACIVGATQDITPRLAEIERATLQLAARAAADLRSPDRP